MFKLSFSEKFIASFERAFGVFGLGILCWMIYRLGPHRVAKNLQLVGWGFFILLAAKTVHYFCHALSWKLILGEEGLDISFWRLLRANLEGEALNYITVTRMGGEPLKIISIRDKSSLRTATASVIVLKFCSILGFWLVISFGFLTTIFHADVTGDIKRDLGMGLFILTAFLFSISWIQKRGMFSPLSWILRQFQSKREWVSHQVLRLTRLDNKILETYRSKPLQVILSALLNALEWVEEIFFIWLTLHFLNIDVDWILATMIGTISLLMNSLFFFVPWKAGAQEGTMVLTFTLLNLSEPMGLSLAILRRMRELLWVFAGLVLFALERTPAQPKPVTADSISTGIA